MLTLEISFLSRRYDPSPWTPASDGPRFEWPPSPWRLLRALAHAAELRGMADDTWPWLRLLAAPPTYHLPPVSVGFAPSGPNDDLLGFVSLDPAGSTIYASWPTIQLPDTELSALSDMLPAIAFLGRSTTKVTARLVSGIPPDVQLLPCGTSRSTLPCDEVDLLAAGPDTGQRALHARRPVSGAPATSQLVTYYRPKAVVRGRIGSWTEISPALRAFRYTILDRPPMLVGYAVAEQARRAAMALYGRQNHGSVSALLSGKDPVTGAPSRGHQHAYFLPTDEDADGALDHLTVFASAGIGPREAQALRDLETLYPAPGLKFKVHLTPTGDDADPPLLGPASVWASHFPFATVRHAKRRSGVDLEAPEDQILLELRRRGFPAPKALQLEQRPDSEGFRRLQGSHLKPGSRHFARIHFSEPVAGPIVLGSASHFGMGLFLPAAADPGAAH